MLKFEVIEELKPNTEILETIRDYTYKTWIQSKNYFFLLASINLSYHNIEVFLH